MLSFCLWCVVLCACVVLAVRTRINEAYAHVLPPVHPGWLPVIGHTHYLICDTKKIWLIINKITRNCMTLGGVIYGQLGSHIYYVITDPEDAWTAANACLEKHFIFDFSKNWIGQGLVSSSGELHKRHRKLLNPAYSVRAVLSYLNIFNSRSKTLVRKMDSYVDQGYFDTLPLLRSEVLATGCFTTFGRDIKDKTLLYNYVKAVDVLTNIAMQRFQKFYLHYDFIYKLTGLKKKEDLVLNTVNTFTNKIIEEKISAINSKNMNPAINKEIPCHTFLDHLLQLYMNGSFNESEVRDELVTNIVANFETTSNVLAFTIALMGSYPEVQKKLYEESIQVVGKDRDVDKNDLQQLVYTKAVIKESLRFMPIAPTLPRYVPRDVKLKKYTMRANSYCVLFTVGMHRDPSWGPDVEQFKPERWLNPLNAAACTNNFAGFSIGKRGCVGMVHAMTLMPVILVHLVRRYQWTADVTNMECKLDTTLKPSTGHEIKIQRRT